MDILEKIGDVGSMFCCPKSTAGKYEMKSDAVVCVRNDCEELKVWKAVSGDVGFEWYGGGVSDFLALTLSNVSLTKGCVVVANRKRERPSPSNNRAQKQTSFGQN